MLSLSLMIGALSLSVRSQEPAASGAMSRETAAQNVVSADDAAKKALNIGAKMPSFKIKDSTGKIVESRDLLKQGNLVVE